MDLTSFSSGVISPQVLSNPFGIKIGSHPNPFCPFGESAIMPSILPSKYFISFPSKNPKTTCATTDLSSKLFNMRQSPSFPNSCENHFISGPGNLPKDENEREVSSTKTGDLIWLYASLTLCLTIS